MKDVNWERVKTFANLDDPADLEWLKETAKDLQLTMESKIKTLNNLLTEPDRSVLSNLCHQMKGISSNFGLDQIHDISLRAEKILKLENWEDSLELLSQLDQSWKKAEKELIKTLNL